jgi:hypothetical protein
MTDSDDDDSMVAPRNLQDSPHVNALGGDLGYQVKAEPVPLNKLFSISYVYKLPRFQRPYVWSVENAERLLSDIMCAARRSEPQYMLGNIYVWKSDGCDQAEGSLLDGLQRVTTALIILSCLNYLCDGQGPASCNFDKLKGFSHRIRACLETNADDDDIQWIGRLSPHASVKAFMDALLLGHHDTPTPFTNMKRYIDTKADGTPKDDQGHPEQTHMQKVAIAGEHFLP